MVITEHGREILLLFLLQDIYQGSLRVTQRRTCDLPRCTKACGEVSVILIHGTFYMSIRTLYSTPSSQNCPIITLFTLSFHLFDFVSYFVLISREPEQRLVVAEWPVVRKRASLATV
jgi:hypothetical protein